MSEEKVRNEETALETNQIMEESIEEFKEGKDEESAEENCGKTEKESSSSEIKEEVKEETEEEDLQTKYLRLAADFQNFRRRSEKEKSDIYAYANEKIVVELLDVIDNFERAMEHKYEAGETKIMEGMEMILKQLQDVLERNHLEEINALNQLFDPTCHHAVMQEANVSAESGTIVKVLQKGYRLNKKVIRPSMVVVAQ